MTAVLLFLACTTEPVDTASPFVPVDETFEWALADWHIESGPGLAEHCAGASACEACMTFPRDGEARVLWARDGVQETTEHGAWTRTAADDEAQSYDVGDESWTVEWVSDTNRLVLTPAGAYDVGPFCYREGL